MHLDAQTVIAAGVAVHLLAALAKTLLTTPKRQAQINAIERKVDEVLGEVKSTLPGAK